MSSGLMLPAPVVVGCQRLGRLSRSWAGVPPRPCDTSFDISRFRGLEEWDCYGSGESGGGVSEGGALKVLSLVSADREVEVLASSKSRCEVGVIASF